MNVKQYTDENYIPIEDLKSFGSVFVDKIREYRRSFMEIIPLNEFDFVNIVETPMLIKKRYSKNVDIKGMFDIKAIDNDFILEIAKKIINGNEVPGLQFKNSDKIKEKYLNNNKDLTIVTNYLIKNIDDLISVRNTGDVSYVMPELTKKDKEFIYKCNNHNMFYSINNYMDVNKSSYETARTGLERLARLELYNKQKVGKKYVYKPTEKLIELQKGSD